MTLLLSLLRKDFIDISSLQEFLQPEQVSVKIVPCHKDHVVMVFSCALFNALGEAQYFLQLDYSFDEVLDFMHEVSHEAKTDIVILNDDGSILDYCSHKSDGFHNIDFIRNAFPYFTAQETTENVCAGGYYYVNRKFNPFGEDGVVSLRSGTTIKTHLTNEEPLHFYLTNAISRSQIISGLVPLAYFWCC